MIDVPSNLAPDWAVFRAAVAERLTAGARAYGDRSLSAAPAALASEVEAELLDVAGWSFLLWLRVRALRPALPTVADERPAAAAATGALVGRQVTTACALCAGRGRVQRQDVALGGGWGEVECPDCVGTGQIIHRLTTAPEGAP